MSSPRAYLPDAKWSFGDAAWAFFIGVLAAVIVATALGQDASVIAKVGLISGAQTIGSLGVVFYLSVARGSGSIRRDFGFAIEWRHWWGILLGFGLQLLALLITIPIVEAMAPDDVPEQAIAEALRTVDEPLTWVVVVLVVVLAVPVIEEIIFRGILLSRLNRSMGQTAAVITSAAVFAAFHLLDPSAVFAVPGLFAVGVVIGFLAVRTGSLSLPILAHAGLNLSAVVAAAAT